jgi:hypothetical protein
MAINPLCATPNPSPGDCSPRERYDYIKHTHHIGKSIPSCPSAFFPFVLQNHQLMIAKYMEQYPDSSALLWHGLGSGKTITSIIAAVTSNNNAYVFTPAALNNNYRNEIKDITIQPALLKFKSYANPGDAIEVANAFIQKVLLYPALIRKEDTYHIVLKLLDLVGGLGYPKQNFLTKIKDAPDYATLIQVCDKPYTGGNITRRNRDYHKKTRKGGVANKTPISIKVDPSIPTNPGVEDDITLVSQGRAATDMVFKFITTNGDMNDPDKVFYGKPMVPALPETPPTPDKIHSKTGAVIPGTGKPGEPGKAEVPAKDPLIVENIPNQLIIIDESQLFISSMLDKLKDNNHTVQYRELIHLIDPPTPGTPPTGVHRIITKTEFDSWHTHMSSLAYIPTCQDKIYENLIRLNRKSSGSTFHKTRIILLSGTPIVSHPAEVALVVNILSGENTMCYNTRVFDYTYGIQSLVPPYDYSLSNADRQAQVNAIKGMLIHNQQHFIDTCKPYISYFANIDSMMPKVKSLELLDATGAPLKDAGGNLVEPKYVYNNRGKKFINILECPMTPKQLARIKYIQFIELDTTDDSGTPPKVIVGKANGITASLKLRMCDYTFLLDAPHPIPARVPDAARDHRIGGLYTGRPGTKGQWMEGYCSTFQYQLKLLPPTRIVPAIPPPLIPMGKQSYVPDTPSISWEPDYDSNSKLTMLRDKIQSAPHARHIIYSNSRISNIMIARMLIELEYREIKLENEVTQAALTTGTNRYAFLTGEQGDGTGDTDPLFTFIHNDTMAHNKQPMIAGFNDDRYPDFKILIIGDAVAEGITLKRVDYMHIYSFPYNLSKMQQIVARAVRNCVHSADKQLADSRGEVTPILYLGIIPRIVKPDIKVYPDRRDATGVSTPEWLEWNTFQDAITAEGSLIHSTVINHCQTLWNAYNTTHDFEMFYDDDRNRIEEAIRNNDKLLPYLNILEQNAFDY